ncbi:MAG: response regulator [Elusimicrobiota bacterium]
MKVLIVDDNGMMRDVIRMFLEQFKHEVLGEVGDGTKVIEAFQRLRPEVVLLDLVMPGVTGVDVLQQLKALDPAAKVVVITAVEQDETDKIVMQRGAAAILRKPFDSQELKDVMDRLV